MNQSFHQAAGRIAINLEAVKMGEDLCVVITGGDRPHIGAVGMSIPRPSLADPERVSATTSVFTLPGHKEDEVARYVSHRLAATLNTNVVVVCGIHVDNIQKEELISVQTMLDELLAKLSEIELG